MLYTYIYIHIGGIPYGGDNIYIYIYTYIYIYIKMWFVVSDVFFVYQCNHQVSRILHSSTSQYGIASFPQVNPQMDESVYQNASGPTKDQSTFMIQLYPHCLFMVVSSIANGNRLPEANIPFIYIWYIKCWMGDCIPHTMV